MKRISELRLSAPQSFVPVPFHREGYGGRKLEQRAAVQGCEALPGEPEDHLHHAAGRRCRPVVRTLPRRSRHSGSHQGSPNPRRATCRTRPLLPPSRQTRDRARWSASSSPAPCNWCKSGKPNGRPSGWSHRTLLFLYRMHQTRFYRDVRRQARRHLHRRLPRAAVLLSHRRD